MPSTFLSGQCRNNTQLIKNVRLSEAKRAGYMWGHLPVTNLSLFLWQTDKYALPQKAVVKPWYPKADRCLYYKVNTIKYDISKYLFNKMWIQHPDCPGWQR